MILELGSILPEYVRQFSFLCKSHLPGDGLYTWPGTLSDHHLDPNTLHLFVYQGSFKKGAEELDLSNGPVPKASIGLDLGPAWACAQGRHEAGIRACMGPGSRCRTFPNVKNLQILGCYVGCAR